MKWCLFLFCLAPLCSAAALDATIHVETRVVKQGLDPYDYCCANWVFTTYTHTLRHIFSTPSHRAEFIRFLREDVSIRTIRYPAGGNVGYLHFGVPFSRFIDRVRKTDTPARVDDWIGVEEFFRFLADGDLRTFLQLNTSNWYDAEHDKLVPLVKLTPNSPAPKENVDLHALAGAADETEKLARWIKSNHYEHLVRIWEIGNEEYGGYSGEAYATIAAELTRRIKKIVPDARVVVTNQLGVTRDEWKDIHNKFSFGMLDELHRQNLQDQIAGVTNHVYAFAVSTPQGGTVNSKAYEEFAAYTSFLADDPNRQPWQRLVDRAGHTASLVGKQADDLDAHGFPHADIFYTEYRLGGMQEMNNQSLACGLGNLQLTASFVAAPRVGGSTIHSLMHASAVSKGNADTAGRPRPFGTWGYDIINYQMDDDLHPRFVSTPVSEAFNLIWRLARGYVLASTSSSPLLFTVATRDKGVTRLLVINRAAHANPDDLKSSGWPWAGMAKELAKASEAGDTFHVKLIGLPHSGKVRVFTLGVGKKLEDRSVDADTLNVHEVKVQSRTIENTDEFDFPPHSAMLLEFE